MNGNNTTEEEYCADQSFLSRWSKRKSEAERQQAPVETTPPPDEEGPAWPEDADMPPLETLTEESDFRGFLSPRVSSSLRRLALRKLFHSATFNVCDGLDDYDEDFRTFAALGEVVTAEMRHRLEIEAKRLAEGEHETEEPASKTDPDASTALAAQAPEPESACANEENDAEEPI